MFNDPVTTVLLVLGVVVVGIAKSGFGGGLVIVAVPLLSGVMTVDRALGVMLPVLIAADAAAVLQHRRFARLGRLGPMLLGATGGVLLATLGMAALRTPAGFGPALGLTVGAVCLLLVAVQLYRLSGARVPRLPDTRPAAAAAGGLAAVSSTLAHSGGPVMAVYCLDQRMDKRTLVATLAVFFAVLNAMKVPGYVALGLIDTATLKTSALLLPVVPIGAVLGLWLHHRVPERPFMLLMYLGAGAGGAHMVFAAVTSG